MTTESIRRMVAASLARRDWSRIPAGLTADAVRGIYQAESHTFRVNRGVTDYLVGARVAATKATTHAELLDACDKADAAHDRFVAKLREAHPERFAGSVS